MLLCDAVDGLKSGVCVCACVSLVACLGYKAKDGNICTKTSCADVRDREANICIFSSD